MVVQRKHPLPRHLAAAAIAALCVATARPAPALTIDAYSPTAAPPATTYDAVTLQREAAKAQKKLDKKARKACRKAMKQVRRQGITNYSCVPASAAAPATMAPADLPRVTSAAAVALPPVGDAPPVAAAPPPAAAALPPPPLAPPAAAEPSAWPSTVTDQHPLSVPDAIAVPDPIIAAAIAAPLEAPLLDAPLLVVPTAVPPGSVPEPGTLVLLCGGLCGLSLAARRRRTRIA